MGWDKATAMNEITSGKRSAHQGWGQMMAWENTFKGESAEGKPIAGRTC